MTTALLELPPPREVEPVPEVDVVQRAREYLAHPAFAHRLDLAVLVKMATDEKTPARERRRAAEALGDLYMRALEVLATAAPRARHVPLWAALPKGRAAHG